MIQLITIIIGICLASGCAAKSGLAPESERGPGPTGAPSAPPVSTKAAPPVNPYGICAHISFQEHGIIEAELALAREAGIGCIRTDFHWPAVQPQPDQWHFERLDATVAAARKHGVELLPILTYAPPWAEPAGSRRPEWLEYVRRTVTRYKDDLRNWEIWNEPNLAYAWDRPDGAAYGRLLVDTYHLIKGIDPGLTVLYGGTGHIPSAFIDESLQAGAATAFDVMNVHPYRSERDLATLPRDVDALQRLLAARGAGGRPLWFTELGWATCDDVPPLVAGAVRAGLACLDPGRRVWQVAVLDDPTYPARGYSDAAATWLLPDGARRRRVPLAGLAGLDPGREQALLMAPEEGFPVEAFDALERYVEHGGILVLTGGVPFYHERRGVDGAWATILNTSGSWRQRFRIGWDASWTRPGIVPDSAEVAAAPGMASFFPVLPHAPPHRASRFITADLLAPGDELIPLAIASQRDWRGNAAAAIRYAGRPGGVVVVPTLGIRTGVGEDEQAALLFAAHLHAFHHGVERLFWYELQSPEGRPFDKELHMGLLHADLSPKPAWHAYRTLIRLRPPGSIPLETSDPHVQPVRWSWRRPDGAVVTAMWSQHGTVRSQAASVGVAELCDFQGRRLAPGPDGTLDVGIDGVCFISLPHPR